MNKNLPLLCLLVALISGCQYENAWDRYNEEPESKPETTNGLLAQLNFEKKIDNQIHNYLSISLLGDTSYVAGVDGKDSSAILFSGYPQCLTLSNMGNHDTVSIFMWFKTESKFLTSDSVTLFDYGVQSFALQLDGSTGATKLVTTQNQNSDIIPEWINSYNVWNYLYAEAGGGKLKILYQGAMQNKELINLDIDKESPGILTPATDILYIGRSSNGKNMNRSYFKGSIDNVRIYKRQLSKSEIQSLISDDLGNQQ